MLLRYGNLYDLTVPQNGYDEAYSSELCYCGEHYIHEDLRATAPPLGIREPWERWGTLQQFQKSLYQFETIHQITYHQLELQSLNDSIELKPFI